MSIFTHGIPEPDGVPVELPIETVKAYVQGEQITPYNFDLLQNYFEGRVIKLLEEQLVLVRDYSRKPDKEPYVLGWQDAIALIKGEN